GHLVHGRRLHQRNLGRKGDVDVTCDKRNISAASPRCTRQRDSHFAAAVIRDEADRIYRLPGGAGCDNNLLSAQSRFPLEQSANMAHDFFGLGHPARTAALTDRQRTFSWLENFVAERASL